MLTTTLATPRDVKEKLSISNDIKKNIALYRRTIRNILDHKDHRFIIIVGPCSFHDPKACLEYATNLKSLANEVSEKIFIIMRVYLEKPRTLSGWKGYLNDPQLNESYCMQEGILSARESMISISHLDLPVATELLSPTAYLYFQDLLSWCAIGARTVESQPHREIASSLTLPVGFKNNTFGDVSVAAHGVAFSNNEQAFMSVNDAGEFSVIHSKGNPYSHLVLRGSTQGSNYSKKDVIEAEQLLTSLNLPHNIIIDCSHGNSAKNYLQQESVLNAVIEQKIEGNQSIVGVAIESFLKEGRQPVSNIDQLEYGCSITDACIGWDDTQRIIKSAFQKLTHMKFLEKENRKLIC